MPERVVGGRYRLVEELASGGFGTVWKAHDDSLGVPVAVKEVRLPPAASEREHQERLKRATREARNAVRLRDHPHVVAVHDVVVEDGSPWTVMRLVDGHSLADELEAGGPLSVPRVTEVAAAVLEALRAAHQAGIVHRDVKPGNVMAGGDGEILLTDFGISVHHADTTLTVPGGVLGSPEYMAPERLDGGSDTAAGDLFSLGVTLYQLVEGISPFRRDTPTATLGAVVLQEAPPMRRAGSVAPLLTALLAKDPAARPTVDEALTLLRTGTDPRAASAPPSPAPPPGPPPVPKEAPASEAWARCAVSNKSTEPVRVFVDGIDSGVVPGYGSATFRVASGAHTVEARSARRTGSASGVWAWPGRDARLVVRRAGRRLHVGPVDAPSTTPPAFAARPVVPGRTPAPGGRQTGVGGRMWPGPRPVLFWAGIACILLSLYLIVTGSVDVVDGTAKREGTTSGLLFFVCLVSVAPMVPGLLVTLHGRVSVRRQLWVTLGVPSVTLVVLMLVWGPWVV